MAEQQTSSQQKATPCNKLGYEQASYKGAVSTLCAGCGHDSITAQLVRVLWEMNIDPYSIAKISGIGCSSKTTAYFGNLSHGFNGVHGRAAALATGSYLANRTLLHVVVSGDGDTASIGLGNFLHAIRRNVPLVYVIENNGVYGLTKGQFSATADKGSTLKSGAVNMQPPIDCCALAIEMGCEYVARSFSGDVKQLVALLKGAIAHRGMAVIDVISPCVTFNNHEGSTKSLKYARTHETPLHEIGFVPACEEIRIDDFEPGSVREITLHDGSRLLLKKLDRDYDPTDKLAALKMLHEAQHDGLFITGLLYNAPHASPAFGDQLEMVDEPLAALPDALLRPGENALGELMRSLSLQE